MGEAASIVGIAGIAGARGAGAGTVDSVAGSVATTNGTGIIAVVLVAPSSATGDSCARCTVTAPELGVAVCTGNLYAGVDGGSSAELRFPHGQRLQVA